MAKNHYLAQCYLKGFSTPEDPRAIWQYRKSTGELRKRGIHKVACRPDYYAIWLRSEKMDNSAELFFSKFESQWPSIRRLLDDYVRSANTKSDVGGLPTRGQKTVLLQFMLIHAIRTPELIESMREYVNTNHPHPDMLTERATQNIIIGAMKGSHDDVVHAWVSHNVAKAIRILVPPAGSRRYFFTTDKPVIYEGDIREQSTEVFFPANRRMVIGFHRVQEDAHVRVRILPVDDVDRANHDLVDNARDEIYAREPLYLERLLNDMGYAVERRDAGHRPELPVSP